MFREHRSADEARTKPEGDHPHPFYIYAHEKCCVIILGGRPYGFPYIGLR